MNTSLRFSVLLLLGVLAAGCTTRQRQPNVIVILADDLGAECLGCYGGESYTTPHLDRLAREGTRFTNAFTQPLCTPTRVELLTGRSNARNYVAFSVLDPDERTFAEVMRDHGYRTKVAGKWQLLGASHYADGIRGTGSTPMQAGFERHALWQVEELGDRHWGPTLTVNGVTRTWPDDRYGPDVALETALDWIDSDDDRPFLFFWPTILPHDPFIAPPGTEGPRSGRGPPALYGAMVEYLDTQVGRLIAFLRARDLDRDTIVLFIGDNGSPRPVTSVRNGVAVKGGKAKPTDAGSRIPFIAWGPGRVSPGRTDAHLLSTVDVLATVLDATSIAAPKDRVIDSISAWDRMRGDDAPTRETVAFHHHPRPRRQPDSVSKRWARDQNWQLFADGRLYEVSIDPTLQSPIAEPDDDARAAAARRHLRRALENAFPKR